MRLKEHFVAHCIGDEVLLVSTDDGMGAGFVRGNGTTALIIDALRQDTTAEEIADGLAEQFDADREEILADVKDIVNRLISIGAIDGIPGDVSGEISSFEEQLQANGHIMYRVKGDSMLPLIREDSDAALIVALKEGERCKLYDVPLYRRESGQYVLHRIVKVRRNGYVTCGDNRYFGESGVTDGQIIGVLSGVVRDGRMISPCAPEYMEYLRRHYRFRTLKGVISAVRRRLKK